MSGEKKVNQIREQKGDPPRRDPVYFLPFHKQHLLAPSRNKTCQILTIPDNEDNKYMLQLFQFSLG